MQAVRLRNVCWVLIFHGPGNVTFSNNTFDNVVSVSPIEFYLVNSLFEYNEYEESMFYFTRRCDASSELAVDRMVAYSWSWLVSGVSYG